MSSTLYEHKSMVRGSRTRRRAGPGHSMHGSPGVTVIFGRIKGIARRARAPASAHSPPHHPRPTTNDIKNNHGAHRRHRFKHTSLRRHHRCPLSIDVGLGYSVSFLPMVCDGLSSEELGDKKGWTGARYVFVLSSLEEVLMSGFNSIHFQQLL
jgi:hypothetical protein